MTSDALKAEICLFMKCVISHYSQRSMGELPNLLAITFPNYETVGNITLVRIKLACMVNDGLKNYFLKKCMGLVKIANHFTVCFDELLNY